VRTLILLLVSTLCWGCFVLDEIDAGQKEMDRYSVKDGKAKTAAVAKSDEPSPKERARQWWQKVRSIDPLPPDASGDIVSCKVDGSVRFMSQTDCQHSGGRPVGG
jgi:hypothetical protein